MSTSSPISAVSAFITLSNRFPDVAEHLNFNQISLFIQIIATLKSQITSATEPSNHPPSSIQRRFHYLFKAIFGWNKRQAKVCWTVFKELGWAYDGAVDIRRVHPLIVQHGLKHDIALFDLRPPVTFCLDPSCRRQDQHLVEAVRYPAVLFTCNNGPIPIYVTSLYCRGCLTRYHNNYFVHNQASIRTYYGGIPELIQSSQKVFLDRVLCERFSNQMVMAWTSSTNCAQIYNTEYDELRTSIEHLTCWKLSLRLDTEIVTNAFFLYSLLLDHGRRSDSLQLPHRASTNMDRIREALEARNTRMVGTGQPEWNHACNWCTKIYRSEDGTLGAIRFTVTDGVTLGHPCCAVQGCMVPLAKNRDIFCGAHRDLRFKCAEQSCNDRTERGFATCSDPIHRSLEEEYQLRGKVLFQLKHRLEKLKISQLEDAMPAAPPDPSQEALYSDEASTMDTALDNADPCLPFINLDDGEEIESKCDGKTDGTIKNLKARFGRRRTHNEELCVASCGITLGRATFYVAEGLNGVRMFWKKLFPTPRSLPNILWYDNNCGMQGMLRADNDTYFENCALPVDVFHFKSKHKEQDTFCGTFCNPYIWMELVGEDGKWVFNSSAAEQTNAWFGGFHAIVRDMRVERYNFFLDEMIMRRNQILRQQLEAQGASPYSIPRSELLHE